MLPRPEDGVLTSDFRHPTSVFNYKPQVPVGQLAPAEKPLPPETAPTLKAEKVFFILPLPQLGHFRAVFRAVIPSRSSNLFPHFSQT